MKRLLLVLLPLLFLQEADGMAQASPSSKADQEEVARGNNTFAFELYGQLRRHDGNLFFSPASISTAFAMTYAGARGDTATEMQRALHFGLPADRLHPAMAALIAGFNGQHKGYELHVANALWAQQDEKFLADFTDLLKADYGAGFHPADFRRDPEKARLTINQWVEKQTEDKIRDLLQPGVLDAATRMVLTNAIYFKGEWLRQFDKAQTQEEDFHLSQAQSVKAPLMHLKGSFNYFDGGSFQALELPYKGNELSMIVLLPRETAGLPALEEWLQAANVDKCLGSLQAAPDVVLSIPRFKLTQQFQLKDALSAMGMRSAFEKGTADFSAIDGKRDLWIAAAVHKAFIDVDEKGTEAAAATSTMFRTLAMRAPTPPVVFRADHPFLFLLRDNGSKSVLFLGRLTDPTK